MGHAPVGFGTDPGSETPIRGGHDPGSARSRPCGGLPIWGPRPGPGKYQGPDGIHKYAPGDKLFDQTQGYRARSGQGLEKGPKTRIWPGPGRGSEKGPKTGPERCGIINKIIRML